MLVGGGGRESAFALNLATDSIIYAVSSHENPTLVRCVNQSGGSYIVGNASDPETVTAYARRTGVDYVFVSADDPLANGVVDALLENGISAVGARREAARIEWDKTYAMELMREVCPEHTPFYRMISREDDIADAFTEFRQRQLEVVVKPQGLTGGKGVRVMPAHLPTYTAAADYVRELLQGRGGEQVLLVEKLHGMEFTVMGLTDGEHLAMAPATYDYPYRLEGDTGAGTGGMGCLTTDGALLPFMRQQDWADCRRIMQQVINAMRARGNLFSGVLNGGFFLTAQGIRFMEYNSRFGDPEALNIMLLLDTPLSDLIAAIWDKTLSATEVRFKPQASVVKYFVAKEYPEASPQALDFSVDEAQLTAAGVAPIYASCVAAPEAGENCYRTLKKSRVLALTALADSVTAASERINSAAAAVTGALEYRSDIGSQSEMKKLAAAAL